MTVELTIANDVATVRLDRPETRNALSDDFFTDIVQALRTAEDDPRTGCIVLEGHDSFFSAGADVRELHDREPVDVLLGRRAELWRELRAVRTPMVAAVSGHCLGGGFELALSCDLIVAATRSVFGQPETGLGLIPGGGGTQLLVRAVGRGVAADLILSGRRIRGPEAHRLGLVARLCADDEWRDRAYEVAREIASRPRVAQMLAKQVLNLAHDMPVSGGFAFERMAYQVALSSADAREGLAAFTSGRSPVWTRR